MQIELALESGGITYNESEWNKVTIIQRQTIGLWYSLSEITTENIETFFVAYEQYYQERINKNQYRAVPETEEFKNCCRAFYLPLVHVTPDGMVSQVTTYPDQITGIDKDLHVDLIEIKKEDPINPNHYKQGKVQCIDIIEQWPLCIGTAVKYMWRYQDKENPIQDLNKAIWYLKRQIQLMNKLEILYTQYPSYGYNDESAPIKHIQSEHIKKSLNLLWGEYNTINFINAAIESIYLELEVLENG